MNHMTTTKLWYFGIESPLSVAVGDDAVTTKPDPVTLRILRIGNIANNARLTRLHSHGATASSLAVLSSTEGSSATNGLRSRWVGQPTDVAMLDMMDRFKEHDVREGLGHRLGESPFSSQRKWMGVTIRDGGLDGSSVLGNGHTSKAPSIECWIAAIHTLQRRVVKLFWILLDDKRP